MSTTDNVPGDVEKFAYIPEYTHMLRLSSQCWESTKEL